MTKAQLRAYRDIKLERDRLEAMVTALEYGLTGINMDGMPRSGKISDPTGQQALAHAEVLEKYKQKVVELTKALLEVETAIECLEPRERALIRLYYCDALTWEEVCVAMSYSWRQVHRIHAKALEKIKDQ